MKKRHLVIPELKQLEKEHGYTRTAGIIHRIIHLIEPETNLHEAQLTEILHMISIETENHCKSVNEIAHQMAMLINGLYQTHLLYQLVLITVTPKVHLR